MGRMLKDGEKDLQSRRMRLNNSPDQGLSQLPSIATGMVMDTSGARKRLSPTPS